MGQCGKCVLYGVNKCTMLLCLLAGIARTGLELFQSYYLPHLMKLLLIVAEMFVKTQVKYTDVTRYIISWHMYIDYSGWRDLCSSNIEHQNRQMWCHQWFKS